MSTKHRRTLARVHRKPTPADLGWRDLISALEYFGVTEAADGSYRLTPNNPERARQMALAEDFMHTDREVLRSLGK